MYTGKSYKLSEFLFWTRKSIFWLLLMGTIPTILYKVFDLTWLTVPWPIVAFLGTATAFIVGFKNQQTYSRTWEARQIWGGAMSASRSWAMMCRDFIDNTERSREIIYRHFAWLTALRYQLRTEKSWESMDKSYNQEYKQFYTVPEKEIPMETELSKYMATDDIKSLLSKNNAATQLLSQQSIALKNSTMKDYWNILDFLKCIACCVNFPGTRARVKELKTFHTQGNTLPSTLSL